MSKVLSRKEQKRLLNYWRKQNCPACGAKGVLPSSVNEGAHVVVVWFTCGSYFWAATGEWVITRERCKLRYYEQLAKDRAKRMNEAREELGTEKELCSHWRKLYIQLVELLEKFE